VEVGAEQRHRASVVDCAGKGEGEGTIGLPENRGSDVREVGCNSVCFRMGFESGSGGKESVDSLREERGRFHKKLSRRNRNGGSRDRDFRLTLLSLSRGRDSPSVCGGGLEDHCGGGKPAGIMVAGGPAGTGGGTFLWRISPLPWCRSISWQTPHGCHIVWEEMLTGHISGDRGQLRGIARLCYEVVGPGLEELFLSPSLRERGWCHQWGWGVSS